MNKIKEFFEIQITYLSAIVVLSVLGIYYSLSGQPTYLPGINAGITGLIALHLLQPIKNMVIAKFKVTKDTEKEVL